MARTPAPATVARVRHAGIVTLICLSLCPTAPARADGWRWPVRGPLLERFHYGADPFAAGHHRGIDIGAAAGAPVRSACAGRVTFTGDLPRAGRTVSVACGGFAVTYLHLASVSVRRGTGVSPGARLGAVGASGLAPGAAPRLYFGVRRRGRRFAYVDPLSLLAADGGREPVPLLPPPWRRRAPGPGGPLGPAPRPLRVAPRVFAPMPRGGGAHVPLPVWIGLVLTAVAVPGLGLRRRLRGRRSASIARGASGALRAR